MQSMVSTLDLTTEITKVLFSAEYRRLANWIDRLCRQNQEAYGDPELVSYVYSGKIYKPLECKQADYVIKRRGLHDSLMSDMDTYLMDLSILNRDKAFIHQVLFALIDPCHDHQGVRDALPDCIVNVMPNFRQIPRQQSEAWTLADNPRAMRQYEKIKPRIDMYAVTRLIY